MQILIQEIQGGAWDSAFLMSTQNWVMLMQPACGPQD